jgi:hypothetical protein
MLIWSVITSAYFQLAWDNISAYPILKNYVLPVVLILLMFLMLFIKHMGKESIRECNKKNTFFACFCFPKAV